MSKNITSLRNHLFDALNRLADATQEDIELETTKSIHIVSVAEAIIKTAEVENQFVALTKGVGSGFIPLIETSGQKQLNISTPKEDEEETYTPKTFDVDSKKNWLVDDGNNNSNQTD